MKNPITAERLRELLDYNPATGEFRWKVRVAQRSPAGSIAGGINSDGYNLISVDKVRYKAHRLAWLYVHGVWPPHDVDHVKGDRADNRIEKLRCATRAQNKANQTVYKNNSTGLKGVHFNKRLGRYTSYIQANGKRRHLGCFDTAMKASAAYNAAASATFGEFARPN